MDKESYYVAGFFDGEGCFSGNAIIIVNTDLDLLRWVSEYLTNIGIINKISARKIYKEHHKPAYQIRIYHRRNIDKFYTYIPFRSNDKRHKMLEMLVKTKDIIGKEELKNIKKDLIQGMTYRELGKKYNHPFSAIHRYVNKEIMC